MKYTKCKHQQKCRKIWGGNEHGHRHTHAAKEAGREKGGERERERCLQIMNITHLTVNGGGG